MWWFLVLLGLLIALAGLAVIALGVSIFVSTFGNTLITTGAVAASGGFVIMAMGLVLRQLERLSRRFDTALGRGDYLGGADTEAGREELPPVPARSAPGVTSTPAVTPAPAARPVDAGPGIGFPSTPRRDDFAPVHTPLSDAPDEANEQDEAAEAPLPRLDTPRRRGELRAAVESQDEGSLPQQPRRGEPALWAEREPRPGRDLRAEPAAPPAEPEAPQRAARALEPPPLRLSSDAQRDEHEEPRILKSGIVGGMAYTLYSDGSIQAELPDGIVRFDSLHELRDHVARTQGR